MSEERSKIESTMHSPGIKNKPTVDIVIIKAPNHAKFEGFQALIQENGVNVHIMETRFDLEKADAIILPGSERTVADLDWMREQGLDQAILQFVENGGTVAGICGGYQILGQTIADPNHIESQREEVKALGLLPVRTTFKEKVETKQSLGIIFDETTLPSWMAELSGTELKGHEVHAGETETDQPWLRYTLHDNENVSIIDGAFAQDGRVLGCYLHGLFENDAFRHSWLERLGWDRSKGKAFKKDSKKEND